MGMTESDKQKVELKPCPFCNSETLECYVHWGEWSVVCNSCRAEGSFKPTRMEAIDAWNTRVSPDREKIREALALLENEFDHGGECDHCNEPMTKHRDTCPIGNTISILKQLTL